MNKKILLAGAIFVSLVGFNLVNPHGVFAATFTVNSSIDTNDMDTGDGVCSDDDGTCSLRAAMQEANTLNGADTINFNIPGAGVHTISPTAALPTVIDRLVIDGSTQPGANCGELVPDLSTTNTPHTLLIELSMIDAGGVNGLSINGTNASNSTIRGLVINNAENGIESSLTADGVAIECNYIGTNSVGAITASNNVSGIYIGGQGNNVIHNNLISGSGDNGINLDNYGRNTVSSNLVGTTANGKNSLGNGGAGIMSSISDDSVIRNNVIVGSDSSGIELNNSSQVTIAGNLAGVGLGGEALGNNGVGISVFSSENFTIGGLDNSERNIISANNGNGVYIYSDCNGSYTLSNGKVVGNYIGTDINGNIPSDYGNTGNGIEISEFSGSCGSIYRQQIGGVNAGEANIIAGNKENGVLIHQGISQDIFSVSILNNNIFSNSKLGIDLAADSQYGGLADTDLGPNPLNSLSITYPTGHANNYLNSPTVSSTSKMGDRTTIKYSFKAPGAINSDDGSTLLASDLIGYRLDFYLNDINTDGAYNDYAQGKAYLGSFIVDGSEVDAKHTFTTPLATDGKYVTGTATLLWKTIPDNDVDCVERVGSGPPYTNSSGCEPPPS